VNRKFFKQSCKYVFASIFVMTSLLTIGYFTPRKWGTASPQACDSPYRVYVEGDQMHVNLILPVRTQTDDWNQFLPIQTIGRDTQENYRYLKFGWGDRDFYMNTPSWSEVKITHVLRALFMPGNPTAMYVQGFTDLPQEKGVEIKCVGVSQKEYSQLVDFIQNSFQSDTKGIPIRIQDGSNDTSGFYEATGHYSALKTCNTWAADGLRAANINTPLWSGLAPAVMRQVQGCECDR
jgi:uncharacterized protein (TIGR02117 family)